MFAGAYDGFGLAGQYAGHVYVCLQDVLPLEMTPLSIISTEAELMKLCDVLKTQSEIAVDTEVSNNFTDRSTNKLSMHL